MALAFADGQFVEADSIRIDPADYGFSRGINLFDPMRVYGGTVFRMHDHLERFKAGAEALNISCPYGTTEIKRTIERLYAHNKFAHSTMTVCLTAGPSMQPDKIGFADSDHFAPRLMIFEKEFKPLHPEAPKGLALYQQGLNVRTVSFSREMPTIKLANYARGFLAVRDARREGWDEVLYTHHDGYITEAPTSNFFCVIDGVLLTPARGMLFGITRKVMLELAPQCGIEIIEKDLTPADVKRATEASLASSFTELFPIRRINDHVFSTTTEGPVFSRLRKAFTHYIPGILRESEMCGSVTRPKNLFCVIEL